MTPMADFFRCHAHRCGAWPAHLLVTVVLTVPSLFPINTSAQVDASHNMLPMDGSSGRGTCVFCHFPRTEPDAAKSPRWSREPRQTQEFALDWLGERSLSSPRLQFDGVQAAGESVLCATCHDDVQAPSVEYRSGRGGHPIGVTYGGAMSPLSSVIPRTWAEAGFRPPDHGFINGRQRFWVEGNGIAGRQRSDLFIIPDDQNHPSVECISCHDPHGSSQRAFLRLSSDNSLLCRTCHVL